MASSGPILSDSEARDLVERWLPAVWEDDATQLLTSHRELRMHAGNLRDVLRMCMRILDRKDYPSLYRQIEHAVLQFEAADGVPPEQRVTYR